MSRFATLHVDIVIGTISCQGHPGMFSCTKTHFAAPRTASIEEIQGKVTELGGCSGLLGCLRVQPLRTSAWCSWNDCLNIAPLFGSATQQHMPITPPPSRLLLWVFASPDQLELAVQPAQGIVEHLLRGCLWRVWLHIRGSRRGAQIRNVS